MKKLFLLFFAALLAFSCHSQAQVQWKTIEQASQVDTKSNKKLFFVDFSTSWCGWCKKMDRDTFSDPVVAAILNKYYIPVHFDAEGSASFTWNGTKYNNPKGSGAKASTHPFTRAILGQKIGYPSFALFSKDRGLIQILQGYQGAYDFSMVLWYFCSGDNNRYTFAEYGAIFQEEIKPDMMKKLGLAK
jgi:thioredoxin-related protein